jgi:hypothetical protein
MTMIEFPEPRNRHSTKLDHDDSGSNRSKIMNVIDSNIMRSGMRAENRTTLFLIPLLGARSNLHIVADTFRLSMIFETGSRFSDEIPLDQRDAMVSGSAQLRRAPARRPSVGSGRGKKRYPRRREAL